MRRGVRTPPDRTKAGEPMQKNTARPKDTDVNKNAQKPRSAGKAYARSGQGQRRTASGQRARSGQTRTAARRRTRRPAGVQGILLKLSDLTSTREGIIKLCIGFAALIALIVIIGLIATRGGQRDVSREPVQAASSVVQADGLPTETETEADAAATAVEGDAAPQPTAASASSGFSMTPTGDAWRAGKYAPEPQGEDYLPVFRSAGRDDKVIAITVDDCFQTANLKEIIQLAENTGGHLTIFPIGNLLKRQELQEVIKAAHASGHEIENHTWSHDGLYNLSDEELARHVFDQDRAVDLVLGVNYHTHFLRPRGGDDRNDLRTHSYIRQLGYYGIAHWSVSGAMDIDKLKKSLTPGAVYLFHCTDLDLQKLREFIPYASNQGYQLITFNEMFGYEDNAEELLTDDPTTRTIIQLEPYERDYKTIKATTYDYAAYEVQAALIAKGFLTGEPDGVYGPGTAKSAAAWQTAEGYTADGVLTPEQQKKLLGVE